MVREFETTIIDVYEQFLRENKATFVTTTSITDIQPEDTVQCTYFKGIYVVIGTSEVNNKVLIHPIQSTESCFLVSPDFLKKVVVDEEWLKVLYGDKITYGNKNR